MDKLTGSPLREPVEERLANRLAHQAGAGAARIRASSLLRRLAGYDRALYRSVARLSTPLMDEPLRRVSDFANFSKPWFLVAGALALLGGPRGRRAGLAGLTAVGAASLVVNQPMKTAGERRRPDREASASPSIDGCACRPRDPFPPDTPRPLRPSPLPSETSCPRSGRRCGWPLWSSRSHGCTQGCITRVTFSSGRL